MSAELDRLLISDTLAPEMEVVVRDRLRFRSGRFLGLIRFSFVVSAWCV
jgi:hypothetical protein